MLLPIFPPEMPLQIVRAVGLSLDAWRGMAAFAQPEEFSRIGVTKAEYEKWGGERVRRWWGGNWNASVGVEGGKLAHLGRWPSSGYTTLVEDTVGIMDMAHGML